MQKLLEYKDAVQIMLSSIVEMAIEQVELKDSVLRVLAAEIVSDIDMPPFDKSAMDGFACRKQDIENQLSVIETVYAGKNPEKTIGKNQCCRIMTGAVIPAGADFVFKKEDAVFDGNGKVACNSSNRDNHICYRGEDVRKGDRVMGKNILIEPKHIPVIAGAGGVKPLVYIRPEVMLFATGTELVEPGETPLPFQIRNTNSIMLTGLLHSMNINAGYGGILPDDRIVIRNCISKLPDNYRVIILTGGVSVGDYDFVPEILKELGFAVLVESTAIKPGKPIVFARKDSKYVFGLSGNPISSYVQFNLYVKPFIWALMGFQPEAEVRRLPLASDLYRKQQDRLGFIPAVITVNDEVEPVFFNGSAHISSLSEAECFIEFPKGLSNITKGSHVNVRSI